jgi:hypothetical protein
MTSVAGRGSGAPQITGIASAPAATIAFASTRSSAVMSTDATSTAMNTGVDTTACLLDGVPPVDG